MATIHTLVAQGALIKLDPGLPPRELELRLVHMSPRLRDWFANDLPALRPRWTRRESPAEQLKIFFEDFCGGTVIEYPNDFKSLQHLGDGIWEMKTADIRLFGWFHEKDCFIGVVAGDATEIKVRHKYRECCRDAVAFRKLLNLDEPKHIGGSNPDDVVSNCYPS